MSHVHRTDDFDYIGPDDSGCPLCRIEEMRASVERAAEMDRQHRERYPDCAMCKNDVPLSSGVHYFDYQSMGIEPLDGWEKIVAELGELALGQIVVVPSPFGSQGKVHMPYHIDRIMEACGFEPVEIKTLKGRQMAGEGFEMDFSKIELRALALAGDLSDEKLAAPTQDEANPRGGHRHLIPGNPRKAKKGKRRGHR